MITMIDIAAIIAGIGVLGVVIGQGNHNKFGDILFVMGIVSFVAGVLLGITSLVQDNRAQVNVIADQESYVIEQFKETYPDKEIQLILREEGADKIFSKTRKDPKYIRYHIVVGDTLYYAYLEVRNDKPEGIEIVHTTPEQ